MYQTVVWNRFTNLNSLFVQIAIAIVWKDSMVIQHSTTKIVWNFYISKLRLQQPVVWGGIQYGRIKFGRNQFDQYFEVETDHEISTFEKRLRWICHSFCSSSILFCCKQKYHWYSMKPFEPIFPIDQRSCGSQNPTIKNEIQLETAWKPKCFLNSIKSAIKLSKWKWPLYSVWMLPFLPFATNLDFRSILINVVFWYNKFSKVS